MILMIQRITSALLVLVALTSCEVSVDVDLPHTERLVVDGFIGPEVDQTELRVLRTLPPLARVDVSRMIVPDASATIEWNGTTYPLVRNGDSATFSLPPESATWNDGTARLVVKGLGKTATAATRIPKRPVIHSTRVVDSTSVYGVPVTYFFVDIEADTGTVVWVSDNYTTFNGITRPMSSYGFKDVVKGNGTSPRTRYSFIAFGIESFAVPDSITLSLHSADPVYDRFLRSPFAEGGSLFGFSGANPYFNLSGDGIGLFIGASSTKVGVKLR